MTSVTSSKISFSCQNLTCKRKSIKLPSSCSHCHSKFCSNSCLSLHQQTCQSEETKIETSITSKLTIKKGSIYIDSVNFLKKGEFLKEVIIDDLYNPENFELVKIGDKPQIIGNGLYGDIFLSKNRINSKLYIIKQMQKLNIEDAGVQFETIENEINIHKRLIHDHILRLHNYYETEDGYYLIMDYAPNGSLNQLLKTHKYFDEKKCFKFFTQILSSVFFLHECNYVHRDIKPENIVIDENNKLLLCDFGLCAELSFGNRITFCGTYEYMAPEVMAEMPYNHAVDIWSLGILLYELSQGISPFKENDSPDDEVDYNQIYKNIQKNQIKFERKISPNFEDLIRKMLDTDKNSRIKLKEIINHPWIKELNKDSKPLIENKSTNPNSSTSQSSLIDYKKHLQIEKGSKLSNHEKIRSNKQLLEFDRNNDNDAALQSFNETNNFESGNESIFDRVLSKVHQKGKGKKSKEDKTNNENSGKSKGKQLKVVQENEQYQTTVKDNKGFNLLEEITDELQNISQNLETQIQTKSESKKNLYKINYNDIKNHKEIEIEDIDDEPYPDLDLDKKANIKEERRKRVSYQFNLKSQLTKNENPINQKKQTRQTEVINLDKIKNDSRIIKKKHFLAAIDILEKAQENKNTIQNQPQKDDFWSFLNPFRCGKCD